MRENKNEKVHEMLDQVQLSLLEQQLLNLLLDGLNLRLDLGTFILGHAEMGGLNIFHSSTDIFRSIPGGDDRSADPAGPPQRLLGPDEHVGDVLVLTEEGDVEQDLQRLRVSRHHHKLRLSSVQSLGGLIGSLPQLLVVGSLLDKIQYLGGQSLVGKRVGLGVDFFRHDDVAFYPLCSAHTRSRRHGVTEVCLEM